MKPFVMDNTGRKCIGIIWKHNDWWFVSDDGSIHSGAAPAAYDLATLHQNLKTNLTKRNVRYFWAEMRLWYWNILHDFLFYILMQWHKKWDQKRK